VLSLKNQIFSIRTNAGFDEAAIAVFQHQTQNCMVYKSYISHLNVDSSTVTSVDKIPFLPISFFKTQAVLSDSHEPVVEFTSSGTTGMVQSRHFVTDISLYEQSFNLAFRRFYGDPANICILALLPSYQEREGSSLIYMVDSLIDQSKHPDSGYFLHNHQDLLKTLNKLKDAEQKTILIGVTYALLDFVELYKLNFPELIVMETGGMKGKRKEMVREELHAVLQAGFGVNAIHSEYGMTELLSQAYSSGQGVFNCPPWMKITLRDTNDPLSKAQQGRSGGINVIDLANLNSCSFIATQDLGKVYKDGSFEVLGRFDNSDIRGCNLLVQ
jgi:phenylacetate-coenzyme A ligase PaaK-like adenylate-forming protein